MLQGYHGCGNLGDDLMLAITARELRLIDGKASISVLAHPRAERKLISTGDLNVHILQPRSCFQKLAGMFAHCDVLVYAGGTCLHKFGYCGIYNNILARLLCRKVVWLGIGVDDVGACLRSQALARISLASSHLILVRDRESALELERNLNCRRKVRVTGDLVWLFNWDLDVGQSLPTTKDSTLLISWRDFSQYASPSEISAAEDLLAELVLEVAMRLRLNVEVVNMANSIDPAANQTLWEKLNARRGTRSVQVHFLRNSTTMDKLLAIARARLLICGRLHPLMVAKHLGKAAIGIDYASKVHAFAALWRRSPVLTLSQILQQGRAAHLINSELETPAQPIVAHATLASNAKSNFDILRSELVVK